MNALNFLLLGIVFVSCMSLFYLIALLFTRKSSLYEDRLHKYVVFDDHKTMQEEKTSLLAFGRRLDRFSFVKKQEELLLQAGMKWTSGEFFFVRLLSVGGVFALLLLTQLPFLFSLLIGGIIYFIPPMLVKQRRRKRLFTCSVQLSGALGTMANALRAGFSFMQALQLIGEETPDPLGTELKRALFDMRYGVTLEEAFAQLVKRLPNRELEIALEALLVQRSSGGNLAILLETIQETIRGRIRLKEEVHALTAPGRFSSWIVTVLPIALGIYLELASPQYFNEVWTSPLGWIMMGSSAIGVILGWIIIRKIVQIEV